MSIEKLYTGSINAKKTLAKLRSDKESYWTKRGEAMALELFHEMSVRVPAYKSFLKKHNFDPKTVRSMDDFEKIPVIDKDNYLRVYPREELCWDGRFNDRNWVISTTSGSSGEPFYFPRQDLQDLQYALTAELYLLNNFQIDKKSTLYVVAFPMGAWIGGLFTYEAIKTIAERGDYNLSIITPGISKLEVIKAVKNLGPDFDQVIIGSYGPFLKDIIDDAAVNGLKWSDHDVKFVLSAETISEEFRDYLKEKVGFKNIYLDTLNHYGTVDMGTMAHETPLAILVRRLALENPAVFENIFGNIEKTPTLTQYMPELFYFEPNGGKLLCSAYGGFPLVRYDLKDNGGVLTLESVRNKLKSHNIDLDQKVKEAGISEYIWNLPFVHVFERNDFSVSFYAFQVYPETIKKALICPHLRTNVTGKFTMQVDYDQNGQQFLEINVELRPQIASEKGLNKLITEEITAWLLKENSEFRKTHEMYGQKVEPKILFWDYEHEKYFKPGGKQKWVIKK